MNHQPLTFSLHGRQVDRANPETTNMAGLTAGVARDILVLLREAGGMLTALQLAELLPDLPKSSRRLALESLRNEGQIEVEGDRRTTVYHLVRPGGLPATSAGSLQGEPEVPTAQVAAQDYDQAADQVAARAMAVLRTDLPSPADRRPQSVDALDLRARLDVIADDLHDALQDGIAAELPHALLAHLLSAAGAIRSACKTYPA